MSPDSSSDIRYHKRPRHKLATQRNHQDQLRLYAPAVQSDSSMYTLIGVVIIGLLVLLGVLNGICFLID